MTKLVFSLGVAFLSLAAVSARAEPPSQCLGNEKAWLENVRYAAGKGVESVQKIKDDTHDPVYEVTMKNGKKIRVECDDSGDDDCQCEVADGSK